MWYLTSLRTPPQRQIIKYPGPLVRVMTVQFQEVPLTVEGFGAVRAKSRWSVVPEVSGIIMQLSPHLRPGLHVKQDELLFEIDPRPYRLAVQRIRAQIRQYEKEIALLTQQRQNHAATLRLAHSNMAIADSELQRDEELARKGTISTRERNRRRQWRNEFLHATQTAKHSLALIGPQIEKSQAAIAVARVELADAELKLSKTRLLAPFDGQVVRSTLDLGEFVVAGHEVADMYTTAAVEIPIAVPLDELHWLPMLSPDTFRSDANERLRNAPPLPPVSVHWQSGERHHTWQGEVVRWEAGLDTKTRTMTLVVEVRDPWYTFQPGQHPPLQPGMFCRVEIAAKRLREAVVIPRIALHEEHTVFLVQDGTLARRQVQVLRLLRDQAILSAGLHPGDTLVISPLTAPVVGMKVRPLEVESAALPSTATVTSASQSAVPTGMLPRGGESLGKER